MTVLWIEVLLVVVISTPIIWAILKLQKWNKYKKWDVLLLNKKIKFNYVPQSVHPDLIQVLLNGEVIYMYFWINGEQAHEDTKLGQLHAIYSASSEKAVPPGDE